MAGIAATSIIDDDMIEGDVQVIDSEQLSITSQAYHVSQLMHSEILQIKDMTWSPSPNDITTEAADSHKSIQFPCMDHVTR